LDVIARSAYECTVCGALWPHPSFKCSGIGGFADHPEARTVLVKVVDDDDYWGAVEERDLLIEAVLAHLGYGNPKGLSLIGVLKGMGVDTTMGGQ
jgi:hypothetical protein